MLSNSLRIAILALIGIVAHFIALAFVAAPHLAAQLPLYVVLVLAEFPWCGS